MTDTLWKEELRVGEAWVEKGLSGLIFLLSIGCYRKCVLRLLLFQCRCIKRMHFLHWIASLQAGTWVWGRKRRKLETHRKNDSGVLQEELGSGHSAGSGATCFKWGVWQDTSYCLIAKETEGSSPSPQLVGDLQEIWHPIVEMYDSPNRKISFSVWIWIFLLPFKILVLNSETSLCSYLSETGKIPRPPRLCPLWTVP